MKIKVSRLVVIMACLLIGSFSISAQVKVVYLGIWSFNAPTAPIGYTYGIIEIKKDSVNTSFTESKYKFPSIWIKVKNDSIIYNAIIDDTDVLFSLKVENETSIKGNAVWDDGETQMILTSYYLRYCLYYPFISLFSTFLSSPHFVYTNSLKC